MVPISFARLLVIIINAIYFNGVKSGGGPNNNPGSRPDKESGSGVTYEEIQARLAQMQALSNERSRLIENQNNLIREYVAQLQSIANTLGRQHDAQTAQSQTERQKLIAEGLRQSLNQASPNHGRMQGQIASHQLSLDEIMKKNRAQEQERIARHRRKTDEFMRHSRPQVMEQLSREQRTVDESTEQNRVRTQAPVESQQRIANEIQRKGHKKAVQANTGVQVRIAEGHRKADKHQGNAESKNRHTPVDEHVPRVRKEITVTNDGRTKTVKVESVKFDSSKRASAEASRP